ncbi:MAG: DNA-processing protein DprA [Chloroflexota bacterium]|nr:DNA-processing protein DprA [Chloroflexota bacterium]
MSDPRYWLGFHLTKGIGPARIERLLDHFGDLGAAWEAGPFELAAAGLGDALQASLAATKRAYDLDRELARVERAGVALLTWDDPRYPARLRQISGAPPVLYVKGELTPADDLALGVVGTRRATSYGREVTGRLTRELAAAGLTIVSGLAKGIDACAHEAALAAGGRTIAVLGCGIDVVYPPEHRGLAARIAEGGQGALVSEYHLGVPR